MRARVRARVVVRVRPPHLEAKERRRLRVEVWWEAEQERVEARERDGLVVAGHGEHDRRDEVHRLAVAAVRPEHAPRSEHAAEGGEVRGGVVRGDLQRRHA